MRLTRRFAAMLGGLCLWSALVAGAGAAEDEPRLEGGAGMAGASQYMRRTWGSVAVRIRNPAAQDAQLLVLHEFDNAPHIQFGARLWVPGQARRQVQFPIRPDRIPGAEESGSGGGVSGTTRLLDTSGAVERQLDREKFLLPVARAEPVTGILAGGRETDGLVDAVTAAQVSAGLPTSLAFLREGQLPTVPAGYEVLDVLVFAARDPQIDAAGLLALRQWLLAGGRLWVMAERVDPGVLAKLLGEDWPVAVVDRYTTTEIEVAGHAWSSETPAEVARVLAPSMEVSHRAAGWPAAMSARVGRGELLVTTVGGKAWMKEDGSASEPLAALGEFLRPAEARQMVPVNDLGPIVTRQIGYEIIGRAPILALFAIYVAALLGLGIVLHRRGRLEHAAWLGAAVAIGVAGALAVLGTINRRQVPLTVASGQVASVVPSQQHAFISGLMSIYSPEAQTGVIRASEGGMVWSDMARSRTGKPLRTIWTDVDQWHWENFDLPSGATVNVEFRKSAHLPERVRAGLRLAGDRVVVDLEPGPFKNFQDVLLATGRGAIALSPTEGGYDAPALDVLPEGQYVRGTVLSDTQRRHQSIYRLLLGRQGFPGTPSLLAWAEPMELGMRFPAEAVRRDIALVSIPLEIERPPPGSSFRVPAPLIGGDLAPGPAGRRVASLYDRSRGEWIASANPATIWWRFTPPRQLLPLAVENAHLVADIDAPGRTVELLVSGAASGRVVDSARGGGEQLRFEVGAGQTPALDEGGGLTLGLRVGPVEGEANALWQLERMGLHLEARIPAGEGGDVGTRQHGDRNE